MPITYANSFYMLKKVLPRNPFTGRSRQDIHLAFRCFAVAIGSRFMPLHVQGLHKTGNHFGLPRVFSEVFRQLTRVVIVGPTLGNLRRNQLNDDVQRPNACEIVGEMGADTKRGLANGLRILLNFNGAIGV